MTILQIFLAVLCYLGSGFVIATLCARRGVNWCPGPGLFIFLMSIWPIAAFALIIAVVKRHVRIPLREYVERQHNHQYRVRRKPHSSGIEA